MLGECIANPPNGSSYRSPLCLWKQPIQSNISTSVYTNSILTVLAILTVLTILTVLAKLTILTKCICYTDSDMQKNKMLTQSGFFTTKLYQKAHCFWSITALLPLWYPILPKITPLFTDLTPLFQKSYTFQIKLHKKDPTIYPSLENLHKQRSPRSWHFACLQRVCHTYCYH